MPGKLVPGRAGARIEVSSPSGEPPSLRRHAAPAVRPPAIEVSGLSVERGGRRVLRDIELRVEAGSVTGLLGPSGCGKTTLMRAVVGVQRVDRGRVTVLGSPAGAPAQRDRKSVV